MTTSICERAEGSADGRLWINPRRENVASVGEDHQAAVRAAAARLQRFAPLMAKLFPELEKADGVIESPLLEVPRVADGLGFERNNGRLLVKGDHMLLVAGSIKARGGIHAVLSHVEDLAREASLLVDGDYTSLAGEKARSFFAQRTISVGSTGNLGLSIGTMAAALGFRTVVHMSKEAKGWKKERLLGLGVEVVQHNGDYEAALAAGRRQGAEDPRHFFVDDEDSLPLLYGYATAIEHLKTQLADHGVQVDDDHPLFVYVPCGVGGAPAGVALGLNMVFGSAAHCFFVEPRECPCVLLAMQHPDGPPPSIYDAGLTGMTEADGLAVPRASQCAVDIALPLVSGVLLTDDKTMQKHTRLAYEAHSLRLEPSAAAGFAGPECFAKSTVMTEYIAKNDLSEKMGNGAHVVWATGGRFMPDAEFFAFLDRKFDTQ